MICDDLLDSHKENGRCVNLMNYQITIKVVGQIN